MLDIFSGLRLVVKRRSISIDNAIFRCHWFFTSTLLVSFSLIITARQYVGQPIECHSINKLPDSLLNSYCWVQSTFTIPQACNKQVGYEVPYPCIDNTRGREIKMFAYYQWVGIVLFIQGLLFHLPYYLWKVWENGLIKAITGGLRIAILNDQERLKKKEIVVEYIHAHLGCHKRYAFKYFLCEFICLINLLAQLWATNKFFDGQFLRYGIDVINYSSNSISSFYSSTIIQQQQQSSLSYNSINNQTSNNFIPKQNNIKNVFNPSNNNNNNNNNQVVDPMTFIFPRITKCTYYDFGSSGDIQKHDALCLLPLNIINEKIYIALWFWFIILALLTILVIFYRLFSIYSESVRCKGLISRCKLSDERDIRIICRHCDVGDWFLFYMVAENLDPLIMREIVSSIANKIRAHFDLKRELGMINDNNQSTTTTTTSDSIYKYKIPSYNTISYPYNPYGRRNSQFFHQQSSSFDSTDDCYSIPSTRRGSMTTTALMESEQQQQQHHQSSNQFFKKLRNRLSNNFFFSTLINAGSNRSRLNHNNQQLQLQRPSLTNSNNLTYRPIKRQLSRDDSTIVEATNHIISSAPPISQMPLNSAPPFQSIRRGSLSRTVSSASSATTSTADTCILEMQTVSSSTRNDIVITPEIYSNNSIKELKKPPSGVARLHRRLSSQGGSGSEFGAQRPQLVRQRSLNNQSLRELSSLNTMNDNNDTNHILTNNINNPFEEIQIIGSA